MKLEMRNTEGFTQVEIMIVVAIIGILTMIVAPQMIHARRRARTNLCLSNLKNIYGAKAMWAMDNSQRISEEPGWGDLVPGYLDKRPFCPEGGSYSIGNVREDPECSISYHDLWGTAAHEDAGTIDEVRSDSVEGMG